ncbi:MAG: T9SS type A sorting domain-containing protein [Bacteroidetes bacterium]|nr:T9SS type A sorting domain-containing protein [Bacteroidota bacterium]
MLRNELSISVSKEKPIGSYKVEFNARNLPSGIYFYQLRAGDYTNTKKMILLR